MWCVEWKSKKTGKTQTKYFHSVDDAADKQMKLWLSNIESDRYFVSYNSIT